MRANINKYPLNKQIASRVSVLVFFAFFLFFLFVGLFLSIVTEETLQLTLLSLVSNACVSVNPVYLFIYCLYCCGAGQIFTTLWRLPPVNSAALHVSFLFTLNMV